MKKKHLKTGQSVSEYLILMTLIGVASISVIQILSSNLRRKMAEVSDAIGGKKTRIRPIHSKEEQYQIIDMGDFNHAIQDNEER